MSTDIHRRAFLTHFEMACEFAVLITSADLIWLLHDVIANGLSITYIIVGSALLIGLLGTAYVLYKHHKRFTHRLIHKYINRRQLKGVI